MFEYLKQHDHHKADHEPEGKIFVELVQFNISSVRERKVCE
jgi:hypothetical protein